MKVQLKMSWWASEKSLDAEFLPEKFLETGFLSEKSLETGFLPEKPMKAGFLSEKSHMLTELQIELSWLALFQRCVYFLICILKVYQRKHSVQQRLMVVVCP